METSAGSQHTIQSKKYIFDSYGYHRQNRQRGKYLPTES